MAASVEYAKSSAALCKNPLCRSPSHQIAKGSIRFKVPSLGFTHLECLPVDPNMLQSELLRLEDLSEKDRRTVEALVKKNCGAKNDVPKSEASKTRDCTVLNDHFLPLLQRVLSSATAATDIATQQGQSARYVSLARDLKNICDSIASVGLVGSPVAQVSLEGSTPHTVSTMSTLSTAASAGTHRSAHSLHQDTHHHATPAQVSSSLQADIVGSQSSSTGASVVVREQLEVDGADPAETVRRVTSDDTLPLEDGDECTEKEEEAELAPGTCETVASFPAQVPAPRPVLPPSPAARQASSGSTEPAFLLPVGSIPPAPTPVESSSPPFVPVPPQPAARLHTQGAALPLPPPPPPSPRALLRSPIRPPRYVSPTDRMLMERQKARDEEEQRRKAGEEEQRQKAREDEERRRRHYDYVGRRPVRDVADTGDISPSERLRLQPRSPPLSRKRAVPSSAATTRSSRSASASKSADPGAASGDRGGEDSLTGNFSSSSVPSNAAGTAASVASHVSSVEPHQEQTQAHHSRHPATPADHLRQVHQQSREEDRPRGRSGGRSRSPPRGFVSSPLVWKRDGSVMMREHRRAVVLRDSLSPVRRRIASAAASASSGPDLSMGSEKRGGETMQSTMSRGNAGISSSTTVPISAPSSPAPPVSEKAPQHQAPQGDKKASHEVGEKAQGGEEKEKEEEKASSQLDARITQAEQEGGYW